MGFLETIKDEPQKDNSLFVEKYRPSKLEDYLGNEHLKETISNFIENGEIPHLLLYGNPGVGKTSLAKLLVSSLDCDSLMINASDENGIDVIRNRIKGFVSTIGFRNIKIIILDESDFLTIQSQSVLRNLMETFSKHSRFILTCNYLERISEAIRSRCQEFEITPPHKNDVKKHIVKILIKEHIKYNIEDVSPYIDVSYPDIRKIINDIQLNSTKGILRLNKKSLSEINIKTHIIEILKGNENSEIKYRKIRQLVVDSRIQDFSDIYSYLFEKVDTYGEDKTSSIILLLSEGQYRESMVSDKVITFMATIIKIVSL
jgi:DNA polymerase III delta prime subunit